MKFLQNLQQLHFHLNIIIMVLVVPRKLLGYKIFTQGQTAVNRQTMATLSS